MRWECGKMILLHGTSIRAQQPFFLLWGEMPAHEKKPPRRDPRELPFQAPMALVEEALRALPGRWEGEERTISLFLPPESGNGGKPVERIVRGIALTPEQALPFLAWLPERRRISKWLTLGADTRFWSRAAKFALELLARQRFVPSVVCEDGVTYQGRWLPVIEGEEDTVRFAQLARAMPLVCRASNPRPGGGIPSAERLLHDFLRSTMDAMIRRWITPLLGMWPKGREELWRAWLRSLVTGEAIPPEAARPPANLGDFYEGVQNWIDQIRPREATGFRTCFRLVAPEVLESDGTERWVLHYHLQATDDPDLLVPAEEVWKSAGETLCFEGHRFEHPQERLLADLATASRLFPPLESSLKTARPRFCRLKTVNAAIFLREAAPLLRESGFGVILPEWWQEEEGSRYRLGLQMRISPKEGRRGGRRLGLHAVVDYDWLLAVDDEPIDPATLERLTRGPSPLVAFKGKWLEIRPEEVKAAFRFLKMREGIREKPEMTLAQLMRLAWIRDNAILPLPVVSIRPEGWIEAFWQRLMQGDQVSDVPTPATFQGELRPYQKRGLAWLAFLRRWNVGACLADDMGLGKTIEVIALLLHDKERDEPTGKTLLVCPTSVLGNWRRELERFAPTLCVYVHYGAERSSGPAYVEAVETHDIVLTTYSLLIREEALLTAVPWDTVILDEAQNIKNIQAKQTQSVRRLEARHRIALTGTPLENRLAELWSIMDFLNPGYLGTLAEFQRRFAIPIERYHDARTAAYLKSLIRPFILRRLKRDPEIVKDLPEKIERKIYCTLTPEQAELYERVTREQFEKIARSEGIERRGQILATLTRLKQICNHPAHYLKEEGPLPHRSGKLEVLVSLLDRALGAGDRALVFTQFTEMGHLLQRHLEEVFGLEVFFLHGSLSGQERDRMIEAFEESEGPQIFILSLKAGGTGLNLTGANHVFHFDRWWNPAVEEQATDRTFRIGQVRNVMVYKLITQGTLEERIDELIEHKKSLLDTIVTSGEGWLTEMSLDRLQELLVLDRQRVETDAWNEEERESIAMP
ncbi:MAG: DEAD/DEAH box helicase [Deltaproteobacteria bacterium]|nr:MAG: DEAD/DEAH box helicase [Deltaproteobacteria bacterium]